MPLTRRILLVAVTIGALVLASSAAGAQTELPTGATALSDVDPATLEVVEVPEGLELRVRELPGTDQSIITTLPNGALVRSTGERALIGTTTWFEVNLGGTIGWSSGTYLTTAEVEADAAVESELPGVTVLDDVAAGTHQVSDVPEGLELNVRVDPGIGQAVITTLPNGVTVSTTGERALVGSTTWLQMDLDGTLGWSSSAYLTELTVTADADVDEDTDDEPIDPADLPGVTVLDELAVSTQQVTDVPVGLELRLRAGPGTDQEILDTMPEGTTVVATGRRALVGSTTWLEVVHDTTLGWSSSVYLTDLDDVASTPVVDPDPDPDPEPSTPGVTFLETVAPSSYEVTELPTGAQLNVRSAPGTFSPRVSQLNDGDVVPSTGRRATVGSTIWIEIELPTTTAWVTSQYVAESPSVVGISSFSEPVPEGRMTIVITDVDDEADGVIVAVANQLMTVDPGARIQDADGSSMTLEEWTELRSDVSSSNPLIADVTVTNGVIVALRQTAMI
ncbi:MAG: SH3 domain-containing protein [Actinomycetota bacterium]